MSCVAVLIVHLAPRNQPSSRYALGFPPIPENKVGAHRFTTLDPDTRRLENT